MKPVSPTSTPAPANGQPSSAGVASSGSKAGQPSTPVDLSTYSPRERILAAALKLFVEQGYFNTNVPDLSRESKCSVGSIYHTFKNKEEVAAALYTEGLRAFRHAMSAAIGEQSDVEKVLKTVVKTFLQFSEINQHLAKYMWLCRHNEFMTGVIKQPTTVGFDPLGRKLTKAIRSGIREKKLRDVDAHILWSTIFGIPLAYVRDWLDGFNPRAPSKVAEAIADSCWRALKAD